MGLDTTAPQVNISTMKLLVTGGLGFIGSNFIKHMLTMHNDIQIINLDNLSIGSNPANLRDIEKDVRINGKYLFIKGSVTNKKLVEDLVSKTDAVINFAAETHVDRSIADPWPFILSNTIGAITIFDAAKKYGKRIVHISTDEVYGDIAEGSFTEEDRLKPSSPYSASKAAADLFAQAYHRTYNLDVITMRCTNNYGPYQFPEKLIPKTIIRALQGLPIPVYGEGANIRDWIYVQDFCEAIDLILRKENIGGTYNVSAGNELKNIDVVRMILRIMGRPENLITFVEDRPGHDIRYSLNSSKIREELGWRPRHNFKEALRATVTWYVENKQWWKPLATERVLHPTPWRLSDKR